MSKVSLERKWRKCPPCTDAWMRWLDYKLRPSIVLVAIGRQDVRYVLERQKARFEEWRGTIRWHQDHIESLCRAGKHAAPRGPTGAPSPRSSRYVSGPSL